MEQVKIKGGNAYTKTRWVTQTALGLALVIVAQMIGKSIPAIAVIFGPFSVSQLITGTLVNCVLFVMAAQVGVSAGVTVGILSAILATLLGIGPIFPVITPLIALGNGILVAAHHLFGKKHYALGVSAGAVLKCAFLWVSVPLVLRLFSPASPQQLKMLTVMFSWPQGITALCGGVLAGIILPYLKTANR